MNYPNPHGSGCPWYSLAESQGSPNIKWCEETLCHWVSEPANTWSNLGYLIIGLLITYLAFKKQQNKNLKSFGPIVFFMGAMSLFYHQSNFYGSQILDFVGMFFFVSWALGMNLIRLHFLKSKNLVFFIGILSLVLTLILHSMYLTGIKFQMLVLIAGLLIIGTEFICQVRQKVPLKWIILSVIILLVAFGFSLVDAQRIWCTPHAHGLFSQGHALWHWIASFAMLTIYLHYSQSRLTTQED